MLENGKNIALVSDCGTPAISDPGYYLIKEAIDKNITVIPLPGACALITALVGSGLTTDSFIFLGFLKKKTGKMKKRRTVYYPDEYKDRIGKSYNDYVEARQLNLFEDLEGYVGQTYGDAKPFDDSQQSLEE